MVLVEAGVAGVPASLLPVPAAVDGVPDLDLTAELITHRFTPGSKEVLLYRT